MDELKPYINVREAYDSVFNREHTYATFKGLSNDEANRHANKMAVKYAWSEFTIMNGVVENHEKNKTS